MALAEQKRALEQLPEVLLEGIPAMIYVSPWQGQPGEMLYVSPQAEAILGYSAPDWIANPHLWLERLDPEDQERALAERLVGQSQRTAFVSEYRLRASDGRSVWIHDEARIISDDMGQPQFWQGVMLEITQRKAAEQNAAVAERARLARELHDSVTQTLFAVNMHVRTLVKMWKLNPAEAERHVQEIEILSNTALAELRALLLEMRPVELTKIALPQLLEQLGAAMRSRCSTVIELAADPVPVLAPEVQIDGLSHRPGGAEQRGQTWQGDHLPGASPGRWRRAVAHHRRRRRRVRPGCRAGGSSGGARDGTSAPKPSAPG